MQTADYYIGGVWLELATPDYQNMICPDCKAKHFHEYSLVDARTYTSINEGGEFSRNTERTYEEDIVDEITCPDCGAILWQAEVVSITLPDKTKITLKESK